MEKNKSKKSKFVTKPAPISVETEILEAFSRLQYEKGVCQVVLQDLAKEVGVAFGTVRYHFNQAGREIAEEALVHVIKKAYIYIDDRLFKARSEENFNPVQAYVDAMFNWVQQSTADSSLLAYYYYLCSTQVSVMIPNQVFLDKARLRIEALVHEAVGRKLYKSPADVSRVALQIHMTLLGSCMVAGTQRIDEQYELQRDLCWSVIEQLLRGGG